MMRPLFILLSLALLAACTPSASPQQAMADVNRNYAGHDINEFIVSFGSPAGEHDLANGHKIYRWVSLEPNLSSGGTTHLFVSGNRHYGFNDDPGEGLMTEGFCEVQIETDADDIIKNLVLVSDSLGKWSSSRCAEILGDLPVSNAPTQEVK